MIYIQAGSGAKEAFLAVKKRASIAALTTDTPDLLESYVRYKIVNTNTYTMHEALAIADVLQQTPVKIRPRTLSCLLLEDNDYLFFIPCRSIGKSNA